MVARCEATKLASNHQLQTAVKGPLVDAKRGGLVVAESTLVTHATQVLRDHQVLSQRNGVSALQKLRSMYDAHVILKNYDVVNSKNAVFGVCNGC